MRTKRVLCMLFFLLFLKTLTNQAIQKLNNVWHVMNESSHFIVDTHTYNCPTYFITHLITDQTSDGSIHFMFAKKYICSHKVRCKYVIEVLHFIGKIEYVCVCAFRFQLWQLFLFAFFPCSVSYFNWQKTVYLRP